MCKIVKANEVKVGDLLVINSHSVRGLIAKHGLPGVVENHFLYVAKSIDHNKSFIQFFNSDSGVSFTTRSDADICVMQSAPVQKAPARSQTVRGRSID
jgi:hypothetical protein